ncbi:hypothetical protein [Sphingobium sp. Ant17]|uniref:hypothetical protein n=1 Tax=Sphingobium sp. Ant17 TaxID=1461752 RepID=UPI0026AFD39E
MQLKLLLIASGAALGLATPAAAQMDHSNMPGMKMPPPKTPAVKKPAAKKPAATKPAARKKSVKPAAKSTPRAKAGSGAKPAASRSAKPPAPGAVVADPHAGHDMTAMPGMTTPGANPNPGAGHDMSRCQIPPAVPPPASQVPCRAWTMVRALCKAWQVTTWEACLLRRPARQWSGPTCRPATLRRRPSRWIGPQTKSTLPPPWRIRSSICSRCTAPEFLAGHI